MEVGYLCLLKVTSHSGWPGFQWKMNRLHLSRGGVSKNVWTCFKTAAGDGEQQATSPVGRGQKAVGEADFWG